MRWQALEATFSRRYRIMYLSETAVGSPTVVTGLVDLPDDLAPFGGFHSLLYGHGWIGIDDPCSPSVVIDDGSGAGHADEFDSMSSAITDDWVVVATDYEGLGGPGSHPLLVGVSEGRSMLDAGRAARQLPVAYVGDTTAHHRVLAGRPRRAVGDAAGGGIDAGAADHRHRRRGDAEQVPPARVVECHPTGSPRRRVGVVAGRGHIEHRSAVALTQLLTPAGAELLASWDTQCFDVEPASPGRTSCRPIDGRTVRHVARRQQRRHRRDPHTSAAVPR